MSRKTPFMHGHEWMNRFSTPAILIRRRDYGDYDLVLTFFTLSYGKVSLIAKAAKKSLSVVRELGPSASTCQKAFPLTLLHR